MTSLLCIHFICFEQHTHKNLAAFARLKAVHLYKTFLHTGQSCQFARFRKFFKFIINFYKQPDLWIIIVLLALSIKASTNNLCNWLISYIFIIEYSHCIQCPSLPLQQKIRLTTYILLIISLIYNETCLRAKRKTSTIASYLFRRKM